ncbi:family 78 glycoside hydrolase catalytic domain [Niabella drilacis]|uniref:Alpha-L-rhamnosidase N-terminal domain-containing protein n=1 Tax=Niabella drilacis (strain DSM 25811 / CCM 8410 / CCUG 62505 / LMG 26954 / E90) TaxID=1285928 RepID=A0A1G6RHK2_NIADE|nr:family 78 glycoside hydrolase catalytic domain [Niabella drilacis]SDD03921.1 Alpha-L-rhamnosidase N-terminal domain-containing protein [Niabella drilacis]
MNRTSYIGSLVFGLVLSLAVQASGVNLAAKWPAYWITCPGVVPTGYGVFHFRKSFSLSHQPARYLINVSADNRYRLFVNGVPVSQGPARGDLLHWYYEQVDIAHCLKQGSNTIAAVVWNMGEHRPLAQISCQTGLIVQSTAAGDSVINTSQAWKVMHNAAYTPATAYNYFAGATDSVDAAHYPWGWEQTGYNDRGWMDAALLERGTPYGSGTGYSWVLTPRDIPPMEETKQRMGIVRKADGVSIPGAWPAKNGRLLVPANRKIKLLIDQGFLTTGYPELLVNGGKDARIKLSYAEALFKNGRKGDRNAVEGYEMIKAPSDYFITDGGRQRLFRPLWFRTWRYIQLEIETRQEPLEVEDIYAMYTGYPFRENASFESSDESLQKIWQTGWRTARLCAHETYFDCPYYEQLQYIADTRIQALISLYVSGDDRLMKKAIRSFNRSRTYEGITDSRFPGYKPQFIPPFSLFWINMIRDHWMHRGDTALVKECLPGIRSVLSWFENKVDPQTGMLGALPHWNFADWAKPWPWSNEKPLGGVPPGGLTGGSSVLTLQLAYTLRDAVELLSLVNENDLAVHYTVLYQSLLKAVKKNCWNEKRQLFADDPEQNSFSQHANIMAVLSEALPTEKQGMLVSRIIADTSLVQATLYYRFYLFRALKKAGMANVYLKMLQPWKDMLALGLTTFAEKPEPARSDCHAWSASPNYDLLALVCGIEPAAPGFRSVRIAPAPGGLKYIKATMPHPLGMIRMDLSITGDRWTGTVTLPAGSDGLFVYKGKTQKLNPGKNRINYA